MSNSPTPNLAAIQRWMQSVITHPSGIEAGVGSDLARSEIDVQVEDIEKVILRSKARTSIQRLAVYGNAYYARLLECLREFFPATADALGVELFDQFTFAYLQRYPSQSYTLGNLADRFVPFLKESREQFETSDVHAESVDAHWSDFFVDLAELEWTIEQVFDGPGVEKETLLTAEQLADIGVDSWPKARLIPVVCLWLLDLKYPVNEYFTAFRQKKHPTIPRPRDTFLALTRRDYVVRRFTISRPQHALLKALMDGQRVGAAIETAAENVEDLNTFATELQSWFRLWSSEGFFQRVELD